MEQSGRPYMRKAMIVAAAITAVVAVALLLDNVGRAFITGRPEPNTTASRPTKVEAARASPSASRFSLFDQPRAVPDIRFADDDGRARSLADFQGKLVLLNIWATWCVPCRREMPTLDRLEAALGGQDFEVVALSIDRAGPAVVRTFYAEIGIRNLAMYIDSSGKATRDLGVVGLPTTLLIDREGMELGRLIGPAEWDTPEMVAFLRARLPGKSGALKSGFSNRPRNEAAIATRRHGEHRDADIDLPIRRNTASPATREGVSS